jgi:hypothetical protein
MATWPPLQVPSFAAGLGPQASDMNTWWYSTAGFMQNRVVARLSQSVSAQSLPSSGANTTIQFDTVIEDPYSGWQGSPSYAWEPPAGYSGWYQVTITIRTVALPTLVDLFAGLGGTYSDKLVSIQGAQDVGAGASARFAVYLVGGQDTVTAVCELLNSGSNENTSITAGRQSTMEITWLSS